MWHDLQSHALLQALRMSNEATEATEHPERPQFSKHGTCCRGESRIWDPTTHRSPACTLLANRKNQTDDPPSWQPSFSSHPYALAWPTAEPHDVLFASFVEEMIYQRRRAALLRLCSTLDFPWMRLENDGKRLSWCSAVQQGSHRTNGM